MSKYKYFILTISTILVIGYTAKLPLIVSGEFPTDKPAFDKFYEGEALPREKTTMLVGAKAGEQADIYIIKVDGRKNTEKSPLIGGSKAVILLPGKHDVVIQLHDKSRVTMPLTLSGVELEANIGMSGFR